MNVIGTTEQGHILWPGVEKNKENPDGIGWCLQRIVGS
jgi:hypothetical protein